MNTPKVGDIIYALSVGNSVRRGTSPELVSMEVIKVGRKLFTAKKEWREHTFRIEDGSENVDYCIRAFQAYQTIQEREDELEHEALSELMKNTFGGYGKIAITLPVLRQIRDILETNTPIKP